MTDAMSVPAAGWYPDPQFSDQMRFWNGREWTEERYALPRGAHVLLGPGWERLGYAVRIALRLLVLVTVIEIALYAWGLSMFEEAAGAGDLDRLDTYDNLDRITSIVALLLFLVAGITWMVWQYQLAKAAEPSEIRRRPGWHAWAWITPVVGLWYPYQNVKDLWHRRFPQRGGTILAVWWTAFVVTNVLDQIFVRSETPNTIEKLENMVTLELVSTVISLLALFLAIQIHRALSDGEFAAQRNAATAPVSPGA